MFKKSALFLSLILLASFLWLVFSGSLILSQSFSAGPLTIRSYGIIMAAAVAAGFYLALKRAPKYGISAKSAEDLMFWLIVGGFAGARLYHVISSFSYYSAHPADIIKVWNGGLSVYGAVFGGLLALWVYKRLSTFHFPLSTFLDWLTPSIILGQIIGRFGNLFNYEAFGYPTNLPWKMFVPEQFRPEQYIQFNFFHPWFLYELLGSCAILGLILFYSRDERKTHNGGLFLCYLLWYNLLRFCLEFLRIDSAFIGSFRLNAAVSLSLAAFAAILLIAQKKHAQTP